MKSLKKLQASVQALTPRQNTFKRLRQARLAELGVEPATLETIVFMTRLLAEARANGNNRSLNATVERHVTRMVPAAYVRAVRVLRRLDLQRQPLSDADICTARKIQSEAYEVAREGANFIGLNSAVLKHVADHVVAIDKAVDHLEFTYNQQRRLRRLRS
jgi:hypothetical protein